MIRTLSYVHQASDEPLRFETIDAAVRAVANRHPDNEAVVSYWQGVRLTYGELMGRADHVATALAGLGVSRGDRIGIWAGDGAEFAVLQIATSALGAVLVSLNPHWQRTELAEAIERTSVRVLFASSDFRGRDLCQEVLAARRAAAPDASRLLVMDSKELLDPKSSRMRALEHFPEDRTPPEPAASDADQPCTILFTSGTTGRPKAVVLTHHNLVNNAWFGSALLGLGDRDRLCVPVPLYHCFGIVIGLLSGLIRGACVVLPAPRFDVEATLAAVHEERCTVLHGVPTMFIDLLALNENERKDLTCLRTGIMAGAPCPSGLVHEVMERLPLPDVRIGYGMTEASPMTHCTLAEHPESVRMASVGASLPHQECKVIDPGTGSVVPRGVTGEICFRGHHVMQGYLDDPEATAAAIDPDCWLHSGDLGVMDDEGCLRVVGRIKDLIIRGGENIDPASIESVLFEHPDVIDVCVFGVPHHRLGEEIAAWVEVEDGVSLSADELRTWASGRMSGFKAPREVICAHEFPRTGTGKTRRVTIREATLEWAAEEVPADNPWGARRCQDRGKVNADRPVTA